MGLMRSDAANDQNRVALIDLVYGLPKPISLWGCLLQHPVLKLEWRVFVSLLGNDAPCSKAIALKIEA